MGAGRVYQLKWLVIKLPIAVLAIAVMAWLWTAWLPLPPSQVTLSSGLPEGIYHAHALRYQEFFARNGVTLQVVPSEGTVQNLERLAGRAAPRADLAFVQGGGGEPSRAVRLLTIARVDVEPLWIFSRIAGLDSPQQLQGLRVSLGPAGSGTRQVGLALLEQVRLTSKDIVDSPLSGPAAVRALAGGALDVVMMVSAPDSPVVRALVETPGVHLAQLRRSGALIERMPYLESRLLPQGAMGSRNTLPARDTTVLATSASLVARDDLHPALQRLAARAAQDIHARPALFRQAGEFPTLKRIEFPASEPARRTLAHGLPWFEAYLPFWWGQVLLRLLVVCLPVALLALWLARIVPAYLRWLLESRVARWYGELKYIEHDLSRETMTGLDLAKYVARLDSIERRMREVVTPPYLMPRWFLLRQHVEFVRAGLHRQRGR
jgi:TRAP-type uncharacterized transport system substrate-binding protein